MTVTLENLIRQRLERSEFPEALPSREQLATVSKEEYQAELPPLNDEILLALKKADQAFRASSLSRTLADNAAGMTPSEVLALGKEVAKIPEIAHAMEIAAQGNVFETGAVLDGSLIKKLIAKYAPKSFVVNFAAMADFIAGVTVYVGFAFNLTDQNNYSIYIGGSVGVGEDALFAIGQGIGLSSNAYTSMTGGCVGADVGVSGGVGLLVDFSVGMNAPYWPLAQNVSPSQWTFLVYALEGIGGGFDVYGGFTLTIVNDTLPDMVQPPAANSTTVNLIKCFNTVDAGSDEIYFTVHLDDQPAKIFRYPLWDYFAIGENGTWNIGFTVNFDSTFTLTLYNSDPAGEHVITTFDIDLNDVPPPGEFNTLTYDTGSGGLFHNNIHYELKLFTPDPV